MSRRKRLYISQSELNDRYSYHPDGYFIARIQKGKWKAGRDVKGSPKATGHRMLTIGVTVYSFHRLIWIWHYGDIPDHLVVDHIDGDPTNNRIENLRLVTQSQNLMNTDKYAGYSWIPRYKRFRVAVKVAGKRHHIGYFKTEDEARSAYIEAKLRLHGEFAPESLRDE